MLDYSLDKLVDSDVPFGIHDYYCDDVLMFLEQFPHEEPATAQLPCASDIKVDHCHSMNKDL